MIFHRYPLLKAGTIVLLLGATSFSVRHERRALLLLAPLAAAVTYGIEKVLVHHELAPQRLYLARTGILYTLPVFGLVVVVAMRATRYLHRTFLAYSVVLMMGAQFVHHIALNQDWRTYRDGFVAELSVTRPSTLVDYETTSLPALVKRTPRMTRFIWPWVMPYQSMFLGLSSGLDLTHLLYNPRSNYVHVDCETARRFALSPPPVVPRDLCIALAEHICRSNP